MISVSLRVFPDTVRQDGARSNLLFQEEIASQLALATTYGQRRLLPSRTAARRDGVRNRNVRSQRHVGEV